MMTPEVMTIGDPFDLVSFSTNSNYFWMITREGTVLTKEGTYDEPDTTRQRETNIWIAPQEADGRARTPLQESAWESNQPKGRSRRILDMNQAPRLTPNETKEMVTTISPRSSRIGLGGELEKRSEGCSLVTHAADRAVEHEWGLRILKILLTLLETIIYWGETVWSGYISTRRQGPSANWDSAVGVRVNSESERFFSSSMRRQLD
ncbi:hypothetical protein HGRIS_008513 [Hohenbuehelia grisea]|uniref:Uncharacterized protein n=1 Tax=Hohenbuehelia grisea TaxID=104357 RepID=A0ABR3J8G0_9AGAR